MSEPQAPVSTENRTWEVRKVQQHPDDFPFLEIHENGREVAHIYHHPDEYPEAERNARRLAAAPDLLAALKELLASQLAPYPPFEAGRDAQNSWSDRRVKACTDAEAVIAKAEGKL